MPFGTAPDPHQLSVLFSRGDARLRPAFQGGTTPRQAPALGWGVVAGTGAFVAGETPALRWRPASCIPRLCVPAGPEPLDSARGEKLKLFVCGVTPYDQAHIGHARTYIVFDAFVRYLRFQGYKVFYLQNITDIDDKIEDGKRSRAVPFIATLGDRAGYHRFDDRAAEQHLK